MPWHLPLDFAYFKAETLGKRMLMGRKNLGVAGQQAAEGPYQPDSDP
ncbi:dihydrofolate reductase [Paenibacillus rhizoplanae]